MSEETLSQPERPALLQPDAPHTVPPRLEEPGKAQPPTEEGRHSSQSGAESAREPRRGGALVWLALLLSLAALGLGGWQWWEGQRRAADLQSELARRLAVGDDRAKESQYGVRQAQEAVAALQGRVGVVEGKQAESRSQQATLETLYQELARNGDERILAEVEQTVNLSAQQLQLAGNVQAALAALESADARLARADLGQFLALRKAMSRDMDRLKALPVVDVPGLSLRIEGLVGAVDALPMAFEGRPPDSAAPSAAAEPVTWRRLLREVWQEIRQLIRIERLDRPDPAVLSPQNALMLRESLKLRLIGARLALLQRDTGTFREDVRQAQQWLARYFDINAKPTQEALATLAKLAATDLRLEVPTLDETIAALRTVRLARNPAGRGH
jgi:uroporphyrin-3 C-methyltransferase